MDRQQRSEGGEHAALMRYQVKSLMAAVAVVGLVLGVLKACPAYVPVVLGGVTALPLTLQGVRAEQIPYRLKRASYFLLVFGCLT